MTDLQSAIKRVREYVNRRKVLGYSELELSDLETILAALPDAARYRWLAPQFRCDPDMGGNHKWWACAPQPTLRGQSINAAIDKAMAESAQPEAGSAHIDARMSALPVQGEPTGYCATGDRCVCGGDTPRVRAGCGNWRLASAPPATIDKAAPASTANSLAGFKAGFFSEFQRNPTEQEIWNRAVRSGIDRTAPQL